MGENLNQDLLPGTLYMMVLRTLHQGPLHVFFEHHQNQARRFDEFEHRGT